MHSLKTFVPALALGSIVALGGHEATAQSCKTTTTIHGDGCIGGKIEFCLSANPDCLVCMLISASQGPTTVLGLTFNVGIPVYSLIKGQIPPSGAPHCETFPIPNNVALAGQTLYWQSFGSNHAHHPLEIGDFGKFTICAGSIGDTVFCDDNNNGVQDPGEKGIPDVTVSVECANGVSRTTKTDQDGKYLFSPLPTGDCKVVVDTTTAGNKVPGLLCPVDMTVPLGPGQNFKDADFCFVNCKPCEGRVTALRLRYLGSTPNARIVVKQKDGVTIFDGVVQPGGTFVFRGKKSDGTMDTEIRLTVNGGPSFAIHTSCSQPIGAGMVFGEYEVVAGESRLGGPLCVVRPDLCAGKDAKPRILTMRYTGDDCSATSHTQDPSKVSCSGNPMQAPMVVIRASNDPDPKKSGARVWFQGAVALGSAFAIDAGNAGQTRLETDTYVHVMDGNGTVLQAIKFHTSCSQPLSIGNQFGSIRLEAFVKE
jgi:hypothetical protein